MMGMGCTVVPTEDPEHPVGNYGAIIIKLLLPFLVSGGF